MATVTGFTAERMLEIEQTSIVNAEIVADNLIVYQRDGTPVDAGPIPGGGGSGTGYEQEQTFASPANDWIMNHGQNSKAFHVYTENSLGVEIKGDITYLDDDQIKVHFYHPQTGLMRVWN